MDIIKSEICKLLTKRTVLLLLCLIILNPLFQLYTFKTPNDDGYALMDYSEVYNEISSYNQNSILEELEERENEAATYGEFCLYRRVYKEIESLVNYDEYLASVDESVENIDIMNRFISDGGYAVKNAEKTKEAYQKLKGIKPIVQNPMVILNVTDNELTDYIAVIMIFIIALNLAFYEKSENQYRFLRTTYNGRRKLMTAKVAVMFFSVLFVIMSLYGINAAFSRFFFGTVDIDSPLQSICSYLKSPFGISIGEFLLAFFQTKFLSLFLLGVFFMLVSVAFNNIIAVFATSMITVLVELILYTKLSSVSYLMYFKYINIMIGIKSGELFSNYVNLNFLENPINMCYVYWIAWLIVLGFMLFKVINYLESTHETKAVSVKKSNTNKSCVMHTSLLFHECYKMLVPGRCLLVLILSLVFIIWWNPAEKIRFDSLDEIYYKDYMDRFYGPLDSDKQKLIDTEQEKFEELYESISVDYALGKSAAFIDIKYGDELSRQNAFDQVMEHTVYLETVNDGWLFFDKGYNILTNSSNFRNRDIDQAFIYLIMIMASTFGIYSIDYANSEMMLLRTTYHGRRKLWSIKYILAVLCTITALALVYIVRVVNILRAYGIGGINAPAASMEHLSRIPQNISILQYIIIIMLMRLIGGLIVVTFVALLFKYSRNSIFVIVLCVFIFIIPLILVSIDVKNAQYILFNPLLLGNIF